MLVVHAPTTGTTDPYLSFAHKGACGRGQSDVTTVANDTVPTTDLKTPPEDLHIAGTSCLSRWLPPAVGLMLILISWELGVRYFTSGFLIPTAMETFGALISLMLGRELWQALLVSNQAMVLGLGSALIAGIPFGFLLGRSRRLEVALSTYIDLLVVVPMAAVIPLLIMATGLTLASRAILVFLFAFVMIVVNARAAIRSVDPSLTDMARSVGCNEVQIWRYVLLPGSLPGVMVGVRLGLIRAVSGMLVAELLMFAVGLGGMVLKFRGFMQSDRLYAVVLIVVFEALILISITQRAERAVMARWGDQ